MSTASGADEKDREAREIAWQLATLARLAENPPTESSAATSGGDAARSCTGAVRRLETLGVVPKGLFLRLGCGSSWSEVLAACRQVTMYLEEECDIDMEADPTA